MMPFWFVVSEYEVMLSDNRSILLLIQLQKLANDEARHKTYYLVSRSMSSLWILK